MKDDECVCIVWGELVICVSVEYVFEVFDVIGMVCDGFVWVMWLSFLNFDVERGKVVMRSGWGASGTYVLSNWDMMIVMLFVEVVDLVNEKLLNL